MSTGAADRTVESVAVTGGSGRLGRAVLGELANAGYRTVNVNRGKPSETPADRYLQTDLLDAGEVYGSLGKADADAVVHLGMVPTPDRTPGHVTFESNATTTYHVLEAAEHLGVDTICLASSLSALGAGFEPDPVRVEYLPLDETHPLAPSTAYGLGKQTLEVVADGFARRADRPRTIASVRFPWVVSDDDVRETFVEADRSLAGLRESGHFHTARNTLFAYLHVDDAVSLVRQCVEADFTGHERFWAAASDTNAAAPTVDLVEELYPDATVRDPFDGHESLISTEKAAATLGWAPERSWREMA